MGSQSQTWLSDFPSTSLHTRDEERVPACCCYQSSEKDGTSWILLGIQTTWMSFFFLLNFIFCIGVEPINNFVTVSGEQWRDSAIHMHVSILPQTVLPSRLPHNIEQSSLGYSVGLCWLSTLNTLICLTNNRIFILFIFLGLPTHSYVSLSFS